MVFSLLASMVKERPSSVVIPNVSIETSEVVWEKSITNVAVDEEMSSRSS